MKYIIGSLYVMAAISLVLGSLHILTMMFGTHVVVGGLFTAVMILILLGELFPRDRK